MTHKINHYTDIPLNDKATFEMIATTDNVGLFQVSSVGMSRLMNKLKPKNIQELGTIISLYRPGPLDSGVTQEYIKRKESGEIAYDHPKLEPILKDTLGLFIYQEQIIATCVQLAGFDEAKADTVRKMMGKKDRKALPKLKKRFIEGCTKNEIKNANELWNKMETFSNYGFSLNHAIGYAHITYYTAYLKAHYPVQFYAALMNTAKDPEELQKYITDAVKNKIEILLPDVIKSDYYFKPEGKKIRFGLIGVYSVGKEIAQEIKGKSYEQCLSFLPKDNLEYLIKGGAFDGFNPNRAELLYLYSNKKPKKSFRKGLFSYKTEYNIKKWTEDEQLREQFLALRIYIKENPLNVFIRRHLGYRHQKSKYYLRRSFKHLKENSEIRTFGMITTLRIIKDRRDRSMAIGEYLDIWNQRVKCVFFSTQLELLKPRKEMYEITGIVQNPDELSIIVKDLNKMED